jgi:multiple sugar transport system substrate-binding protein
MTRHLNRRAFVQRSAAGAAGASLAMFGAQNLRRSGAQTPEPGTIVIPDSGVEIPTEDVSFRWVDSGDLKALFYTEFHAAYQEAHPNITIQYAALP